MPENYLGVAKGFLYLPVATPGVNVLVVAWLAELARQRDDPSTLMMHVENARCPFSRSAVAFLPLSADVALLVGRRFLFDAGGTSSSRRWQ